MNSFMHDLRYGFRMLRKNPGLSVAAILTLALGIGANVAIFSFVDALYYRPLPVSHPEQIVAVFTSCPTASGGVDPQCSSSVPDIEDIKAQAKSLQDIGYYERRGALLMENGEVTHLIVNVVSDNWMQMMGIQPAVGRVFTAAEQAQGDTPPEIMLSYSFWKRHYNSDPSVVGKVVTFTGRQWAVIGVLPDRYRGTLAILDPELTMSLTSWSRQFQQNKRLLDREYRYWEGAYGRLREGASIEQLNAELATISSRLQQAYPKSNANRQFSAVMERDSRGETSKRLSMILTALAALVLLIACANVANLLLARSEARRKEMATRLALGATRWRIARQFFLESVLVAALAGIAGILIGKWTVDALPMLMADIPMPISIDARLDARALLFAVTAAFLAVFVFGVAPAADASRTKLMNSMRQQTSSGADTSRRPWLRDGMVVVQMAISLMLIVSTGLLLRTLFRMEAMDPGFSARTPMLIAMLDAPGGLKGVPPVEFFKALQRDLASLPGVRSVAFASRMPMGPSGGGHSDEIMIPGKLQANGRGVRVLSAFVSRGYFETLGTRVVRGRAYNQADDDSNLGVAVVNQSFARKFWGDEDAVGKHFTIPKRSADGQQAGKDFEVVGVVEDGKYNNITENPQPYLFLNMSQFRDADATFMVATSGDPSALAMPVRRMMRDQHRMIVTQLITLREFMRTTMFTNRLAAQLVSVMCLLGVFLAAIGLYGVITFLVGRRTHEVGIRMALGAQRQSILVMFLRQGLVLVGIGLVLGIGGGLAISKTLSALLYGVSPRDPIMYIAASGLLVVVAALATYIPARRATQVHPMEALRYE